MAIILFDNQFRKKLFPLTATKAVADLRIGMLKRKEWWQFKTNQPIFIHTEKYLQPLYAEILVGDHIWIDASIIANDDLLNRILLLDMKEALADGTGLIAGRSNIDPKSFDPLNSLQYFEKIIEYVNARRITFPQQIFQCNDKAIRNDFYFITKGKKSNPISSTNQTIAPENIFIDEGASVEHSILNASTGPIYIGKKATVMEGCIIRGPMALCDGATLKMGAKIYGATTIGIKSVVGGEIKNSIISDFSNKAHDGYLGDSVIGEWCNLGAGTTNSNVKNNAGQVKLWNYFTNTYEPAGQKCGAMMGDYSRAAINSSINTGSSIGVCCNIFGDGLLPTLINHFSWGTKNRSRYNWDKALEDINNWKKLKGKILSDDEVSVLKYIFETIN